MHSSQDRINKVAGGKKEVNTLGLVVRLWVRVAFHFQRIHLREQPNWRRILKEKELIDLLREISKQYIIRCEETIGIFCK